MKSIFEPGVNNELIDRLDKLSHGSPGLWGKMDVAQMLRHCQKPLDVAEGKLKLKRGLIGILFGKMVKKNYLQSKDLKKNMRTVSDFLVTDKAVFATEKEILKAQILRFNKGPEIIPNKTHPFFGYMTDEEWGQLQYVHLNHHLTQFGV